MRGGARWGGAAAAGGHRTFVAPNGRRRPIILPDSPFPLQLFTP